MSQSNALSLKIANYKCFGSEPQGFERLMPVNLLIGRNSSGKSSLLDLFRFACDGFAQLGTHHHHEGKPSELHVSMQLTEQHLRAVFADSTSGGGIPGNHWQFGKQWIGKTVSWKQSPNGASLVTLDPPFDAITHNRATFEQNLVGRVVGQHPLTGKIFRCLNAERNIEPEPDSGTLDIEPNGRGATNLVHQILHDARHPQKLISKTFLLELNAIYSPDVKFQNIYARKQQSGLWEMFLESNASQSIALSQSGSGLKTIILVLAHLHLLPALQNRPPSQCVFAFEELENNLHPAAQRRLLAYLRKFAETNGCMFVLTTHSSVAIDMFARDNTAQIIHVTHAGTSARARTVTTYVEHRGILDDLDIRSSDLLQANGIIWVEGPTDRIYLNLWIELWSGGELKEGLHYQIVFYGGRLLAHLSADSPSEQQDLISILNVNRNAAILIDSDKSNAADKINATKERLCSEFRKMEAPVWITAGREIEHYVHPEAIGKSVGVAAPAMVDQFEEFSAQLDKIKAGAGKQFENNKMLFAEKVIEHITKAHLEQLLDLSQQLGTLCARIRVWNGGS